MKERRVPLYPWAPRPRSWLALAVAVGLAVLAPAMAQEQVYEDPGGAFTVPVPTGWEVRELDGAVSLAPPEGELAVHLAVVEGHDLEDAIAVAWGRVEPDFDAPVDQRQEPPADEDVEQRLLLSYEVGEERVAQALAQAKEGRVHVLLIRGDLADVQRRASQVNVIQTGLTLQGSVQRDLSGETPAAFDAELAEAFDAYVREALERFEVPGASVVVVRGGEIVHLAGYGLRDREEAHEVTPQTLMMIGSATKTMTTMMMATLVDDGRLSWHTRALDVLPSFSVADAELTERITVEDLVCACTGVPRRDLELLFNAEELTAEQIVASLADFEFFTDFGEAFQYSNQLVAAGGYGAALAAADDGETDLFDAYVSAMRERVLDPVGMADSTFSFAQVRAREDRATPYGLRAGFREVRLPLSTERFLQAVAPAGGLWSNAQDMGRYLITLLRDGVAPAGHRVVSEENLHHTWEPQVPISADTDYGLGWMVGTYQGLRVLSHGGNTLGFTAEVAIVPQADVAVAVLANRRAANPFAEAVRVRLLELLYEQPGRFDEQASFSHRQLREQLSALEDELEPGVDRDRVEPFLGRYRNDALGRVRLILEEDGALVLDAGAFASELRPRLDDAGDVEAHVMIDPPLPELPVRLERGGEEAAGEPRLSIGQGASRYTFVWLGE